MTQTPRAVIYQVAAHVNFPQGGNYPMAGAPALAPPPATDMSFWRRLVIVASNLEVVVDILAILALVFIPDPWTKQSVVVAALVFTALGDLGVLYGLFKAPVAVFPGDPGMTRPNMKKSLNAATTALVLALLGFVIVTVDFGLGPFVTTAALVVLFVVMLALDGTAATLAHRHA